MMKKGIIRISWIIFTVYLISNVNSAMGQITLDPPVIDSISVDTLPNGQYRCVLGWEPYDWTGYNTDSSGFIVRDVIPITGFGNPDTIHDAFATFYFDSVSNPVEEIQGFRLDAFTHINDQLILGEIAYDHSQNMQVEVTDYDSCQTAVTLSWNTYYSDEAPSGTIEPPYEVFAVSDNDFRKESTSSNSFIFSGLNLNENYTFRVRAIGPDFTSTSTPTEYFTNKPEMPPPAKVSLLETNESFSNNLNIELDSDLTGRLLVFRSSDLDFSFDTIEDIYLPNENVEIIDDLGTNEIAYYYLEASDLCLMDQISSDTVNSIILTLNDRISYIELSANDYEFGEATYVLQRLADGQLNLFNVSSPIFETDEEILQQPLTNPEVIYRVKALTENSIQIISNPATVIIKDRLKWPNAIIAGHYGVDGVFRPYVERSVPERYNLKIFNKWGQLLFESDNVENGWDGTFNGNLVMPGGYLYVATYKFVDSKEKVKKGTVSVIH